MKKTLIIFAGILAVLALGAGLLFWNLSSSADDMQNSAHAYIDKSISKIVSHWKAEELINSASPALLKVASKEQFTTLFTTLSEKLGPLEKYKGSTGRITMTPSIIKGKVVTGTYEAEAVFAKDTAVILCRIISNGDQWQIEEFRVNSEALVH